MNNDKILIVVPVMNLWDRYTRPMLESIKSSIPWAVYVIDNASTDNTSQLQGVEKLVGEKLLIYKRNDTNVGCAGGWNQGVQFAIDNGFTHMLILNNDTLLGPKTVDALYNRIKQGDKLLVSAVDVSGEVMVATDILNPDDIVNNKEASEAPHPNFSCFMISLETIEKVGMFEEGFYPAYFEDNDYHYRLKLAGGSDAGIATTSAVFYHYGSRTQNESGNVPVVPGNKFEENRQFFIKKWGGAPGNEVFTTPFNDQNNDIRTITRRG